MSTGTDLNDFKCKVIIPFAKLLEEGKFKCYFEPEQKEIAFCGGINFILGDHMGQIKEMGVPSPRCKFGVDKILLCKTEVISGLFEKSERSLKSIVRSSEDCMIFHFFILFFFLLCNL